MISRELVQNMFDEMRAKAKWNIDGVCLWGYFFIDQDRLRLLEAASALEAMGYRVVGILEPASEDDDQSTLTLHVERVEQHTVDSLDTRNRELDLFAEEFELESYDGMDVGPVENRDV